MSDMTAPAQDPVTVLHAEKIVLLLEIDALKRELSRSRGELAEAKAQNESLAFRIEASAAAALGFRDQRDEFERSLKRYEPVSLYNGKSIYDYAQQLSETRAERDAAVALVAKLEAVVRDGIEHVESDAGAWGGWLVRAQMALRAIKKQGS